MRNGIRAAIISTLICFPTGLRAASAQTAPADREQAGARRPVNVVLLMTDQQTYHALGCTGNPVIRTPNLDRLASEGTLVRGMVCATPFCSPTRASFRTGLWPHTHGIVANVGPDHAVARAGRRNRAGSRADKSGLSDEQVSLDNLLFDHGYKLEHLGKWHLGDVSRLRCYSDKKGDDPDRIAYAKWRDGLGESVIDHTARPGEEFADVEGGVFVPEAIRQGSARLKGVEQASKREGQAVGRSAVAPRAQFETWLVNRALEFLDKHASDRFMLTVSLSPPHAPWIAPDPYYSMYDPARLILPASYADRPPIHRQAQATRMGSAMGEAGLREYLRCYYAQVTMVDEQFGRILNRLHELALDQNTLVIFVSDHGDMQAAHGMMGKSVRAFFEEIIHTPLIVRYPPAIPAGHALELNVNSVDLMPTVLDYVGLPTPRTAQGRSIRSMLEGRVPPDDAPAFCERGLSGTAAQRMIRTAEWKYCLYGEGRRELFCLRKDPGETKNLADDPAYREQRSQLEGRLREWMERTGDPALKDLLP